MPVEGADFFCGSNVPQLERLVRAAGQRGATVRRESDRIDNAVMPAEGASGMLGALRLESSRPLSLGLVRLAPSFRLRRRSRLAFLLRLNSCQPLSLGLIRVALCFRLGRSCLA